MDQPDVKVLALGLIARRIATLFAGGLISAGLVQPTAKEQFITIGSGIIIGGVEMLFAWWREKGRAQVAAALRYVTGRSDTHAAVITAQSLPPGSAVK